MRYFVKWRGRSYLHATWESKASIETADPMGKSKLKRFEQEHALREAARGGGGAREKSEADDALENELFSPEVLEVARIFACDQPSIPRHAAFAFAFTPNHVLSLIHI